MTRLEAFAALLTRDVLYVVSSDAYSNLATGAGSVARRIAELYIREFVIGVADRGAKTHPIAYLDEPVHKEIRENDSTTNPRRDP